MYPYFFIDTFKVWTLLYQFHHEILLINMSDRFLDIDMDGLLEQVHSFALILSENNTVPYFILLE